MFVRFVIDSIDPDSGEPLGVFQAMYQLARRGELSDHEDARWAEIRGWFNSELERPERLSRSRRRNAKSVAISWFRDSAVEHISRVREITSILADHGVRVTVLRSERPGFIVYEDKYQIVAEPFRSS